MGLKISNQFEKFTPKIKFDPKHNYPSPSQPIRARKCTMAGLETINFRNSQSRRQVTKETMKTTCILLHYKAHCT